MNERRGLWSLLTNPLVYETFHHLIGARRWMRRFARDVIQARSGERVLDIGCGPGALLHYLPGTNYIGLDRNAAYIERARHEFGSRGTFICDDVSNLAQHAISPVDVAVAIGLLHHLDDNLALNLLRAVARTLKPTGRLITVDPCFHPDQSALQRFVVRHDRGMHVRRFERYAELCENVFASPKADFEHADFPFPYSICILRTA